MILDEQAETILFLSRNAGGRMIAVETVRTHISTVILTADRAYKLKRAVRFPYLDFSTPKRRLAACNAELALNRRTAPDLYLAVRTITRADDGKLAFDGPGQLVDAVVEMRLFDQDSLFDRMAHRKALTPAIMTSLAQRLAAFHDAAAISQDHGGAAGIAAVLSINDASLRATALVSVAEANQLKQRFDGVFAHHRSKLDARRKAGKVRRCHGDLMLRNICLLDGEPTLFDCIEFDEAIATIDVLYDLAFLLMDLWRRDSRDLANLVFNRYLDARDETDGLILLPFFMAMRAVVRAHVTAAQAADFTGEQARPLLEDARGYVDLALALLTDARPILLAIGGLSGTGKSVLAASVASHLAPPPGARILNSDRMRKRLHGVPAEVRLPEAAYEADVSVKVYAAMREQAAATLAIGWPVIADAVFDRPAEREALERAATCIAVPVVGIWLEAPEATLLARIAGRTHDPSDATAAVLLEQLQQDCGDIRWRRVDSSNAITATRDLVLPECRASARP